jgi:hypothetical protein
LREEVKWKMVEKSIINILLFYKSYFQFLGPASPLQGREQGDGGAPGRLHLQPPLTGRRLGPPKMSDRSSLFSPPPSKTSHSPAMAVAAGPVTDACGWLAVHLWLRFDSTTATVAAVASRQCWLNSTPWPGAGSPSS